MNFVSEYRVQTVGGVVMILLGFIYWMFGGTMLTFSGHVTDENSVLAPIVRQVGILALALPLVWAVFTIKKERDPATRWTKKFTILSAIPIALIMFYLLAKSVSYGRITPHYYLSSPF